MKIYLGAVSQKSDMERLHAPGLAGLLSTLNVGLKAHRICLALVLKSCLTLHVALTMYFIVHEG